MRFLALILVLLCGGCALPAPPAAYPYDLYLPKGYEAGAGKRWPLILFLHGASGGNPSGRMIGSFVQEREEYPFIVIAPRTEEGWSRPQLEALLRDVEARFRIDPKRRYLTGLSMGAHGAASLGARNPQHFAAVALIAGAGEPEIACALRRVPVLLIHNRADDIVSVGVSQRYELALRRCGGKATLTINETLRPGQWPHDAWTDAYTSPALYQWFLSNGGR